MSDFDIVSAYIIVLFLVIVLICVYIYDALHPEGDEVDAHEIVEDSRG